ncbi:collagen alpha-1(I) chain-like [Hippopotamus amphibius kiboko]|uniref:collagen alpha-1(I) chain-like n=1 Tax=Hippopotamus amphibius kiboko TaxID=575201 RepID=UPI002599E0BD|nr:collagen alpha-1(I) chain-like [Hippopotamus amphibius kiboko]
MAEPTALDGNPLEPRPLDPQSPERRVEAGTPSREPWERRGGGHSSATSSRADPHSPAARMQHHLYSGRGFETHPGLQAQCPASRGVLAELHLGCDSERRLPRAQGWELRGAALQRDIMVPALLWSGPRGLKLSDMGECAPVQLLEPPPRPPPASGGAQERGPRPAKSSWEPFNPWATPEPLAEAVSFKTLRTGGAFSHVTGAKGTPPVVRGMEDVRPRRGPPAGGLPPPPPPRLAGTRAGTPGPRGHEVSSASAPSVQEGPVSGPARPFLGLLEEEAVFLVARLGWPAGQGVREGPALASPPPKPAAAPGSRPPRALPRQSQLVHTGSAEPTTGQPALLGPVTTTGHAAEGPPAQSGSVRPALQLALCLGECGVAMAAGPSPAGAGPPRLEARHGPSASPAEARPEGRPALSRRGDAHVDQGSGDGHLLSQRLTRRPGLGEEQEGQAALAPVASSSSLAPQQGDRGWETGGWWETRPRQECWGWREDRPDRWLPLAKLCEGADGAGPPPTDGSCGPELPAVAPDGGPSLPAQPRGQLPPGASWASWGPRAVEVTEATEATEGMESVVTEAVEVGPGHAGTPAAPGRRLQPLDGMEELQASQGPRVLDATLLRHLQGERRLREARSPGELQARGDGLVQRAEASPRWGLPRQPVPAARSFEEARRALLALLPLGRRLLAELWQDQLGPEGCSGAACGYAASGTGRAGGPVARRSAPHLGTPRKVPPRAFYPCLGVRSCAGTSAPIPDPALPPALLQRMKCSGSSRSCSSSRSVGLPGDGAARAPQTRLRALGTGSSEPSPCKPGGSAGAGGGQPLHMEGSRTDSRCPGHSAAPGLEEGPCPAQPLWAWGGGGRGCRAHAALPPQLRAPAGPAGRAAGAAGTAPRPGGAALGVHSGSTPSSGHPGTCQGRCGEDARPGPGGGLRGPRCAGSQGPEVGVAQGVVPKPGAQGGPVSPQLCSRQRWHR